MSINYCKSCKNKIVLHAFSYGECELCGTEVTTAHIPCDKICLECSEKYGKCESCGLKMGNREIILKIIGKLEKSEYIDTAEHLYDGIKEIKRNLDTINDGNLSDFMWALNSSTVLDTDGVVSECIDMMNELIKNGKNE